MIVGQRVFPGVDVGTLYDHAFTACPAAEASDPLVRRTLVELRRIAEGYGTGAERSARELSALDVAAAEVEALRVFQEIRAIEEAKLAAGAGGDHAV